MSKLRMLRPRVITLQRTNGGQVLQVAQRLAGAAGVERRRRWLERHPLCVQCEALDRVTAGHTPDHIIPLWAGGVDDETNLQTLCKEHHDIKTAREQRERFGKGG